MSVIVDLVTFPQTHVFAFPKSGPVYPGDDLFFQAVRAKDYRTVNYWFDHVSQIDVVAEAMEILGNQLETGDCVDLVLSLIYRGLTRYKKESPLTASETSTRVRRAISSVFRVYPKTEGPIQMAHFIQAVRGSFVLLFYSIEAACDGGHGDLFDALLYIEQQEAKTRRVGLWSWLAAAIRKNHTHMFDRITRCYVQWGYTDFEQEVEGSFWQNNSHLMERYYQWMARPMEADEIGRILGRQ